MEDLSPPARLTPDDPVVVGRKDSERIVATVNGVPIPESRLKWAMENRPEGMESSKREMLNALIDEELLFQEALKRGFYDPHSPDIERGFVHGLVVRFLLKRFVEDYPPEAIPKELLKKLYDLPPVQARFNHKDIYRFYDLHWICCHHPGCGNEDCFNIGRELMNEVYQRMKEQAPISKEEIHDLVRDLHSIAPKLGVQDLNFTYWWDKHQQRGRRIFDDTVVNAVISLKEGEFSKPVQSAYGWHILYLYKHEPEIHKSFDDPEVQKVLREKFYKKFQRAEFNTFLFHRLPWKEFEYLKKVVAPILQKGQPVYQDPSELYPVEIDQGAIDMVSAEGVPLENF